MSDLVRAWEVALKVGLSESMIYKLAHEGAIPAYKAGAAWRFDIDEVKAAMRERAMEKLA